MRTISAALGFAIACWLGIAVAAVGLRADGVAHAGLGAEALAAAQADPGLGHRLAREQELDRVIAAKLASVPIPNGLCDSVLARADVSRSVGRRRFVQRLALAACVTLLGGVAAVWWSNEHRAVSFANADVVLHRRRRSTAALGRLRQDLGRQQAVTHALQCQPQSVPGSTPPAIRSLT